MRAKRAAQASGVVSGAEGGTVSAYLHLHIALHDLWSQMEVALDGS